MKQSANNRKLKKYDKQYSLRELLWPMTDSRTQKSLKKTMWILQKYFTTGKSSKGSNVFHVFNSTSRGCFRYFFLLFDDNDGLSHRSYSGIYIEGRTAEKAPTNAFFGSLLPQNGTRWEGRSPILDKNKRKDPPQDSRLIALIFFVSRFATSYPPPFFRVGKVRPPWRKTQGRTRVQGMD